MQERKISTAAVSWPVLLQKTAVPAFDNPLAAPGLRQQSCYAFVQYGMHKPGCDFRKGLKHKNALVKARMRNCQLPV
jgi:hypothetical protein